MSAPGTAFRCGTIAIAGRPNTGKSSLLNRLVGERLAIVSRRAQTTRHLVRGVLTTADCQYVFVDAPGLLARRASGLHRTLNRRAVEAAHDADAVACVLEAGKFGAADLAVLERLPQGVRTVAVVNKIDLVKRPGALLPYLDRLGRTRDFHAIVPVSALTGRNVARLLQVLRQALPEAPALFPADQLTDRDERFFAAELLREKLFHALGEELPYSCEVVIDGFREEGRLRRVEATILVERDSQKGIVVGARGIRLKGVAEAARKDMERLFGGRVYLGVWVRVRKGWTDDERVLRALGYA